MTTRQTDRRAHMRRWTRGLVGTMAVAYPAALVVAVAALRFIGERWWFTSAALYLPRVVLALPLPLVVLATALTRQRTFLALQGVSLLLVLFPLMGLVLPTLRFANDGARLRVMSLNADSAAAGVDAVTSAIDQYHPDLLLMQEIQVPEDGPLVRALRLRFPTVHVSGQFIVASRFAVTPGREPDRFFFGDRLHSPRYMRYVVETSFGSIPVYNVHPISPRQGFYSIRGAGLRKEILSGRLFEGAASPVVEANTGLRTAELEEMIRSAHAETGSVLIIGDTNLPGLSPLLAELGRGYVDGFTQGGWGFGYTFPSRRPWMRIDRMLATPDLAFSRFEVGCPGASDHRCIVAEIRRR